MRGDLRRHESELLDFDLNGSGARRSGHKDKKEHTDAGDWATHLDALLEFRRSVFGVLLMPLKEFQARAEQILELRIAGRRTARQRNSPERVSSRNMLGNSMMSSRIVALALALLLGSAAVAFAQSQRNYGPNGPATGDTFGEPYSGSAAARRGDDLPYSGYTYRRYWYHRRHWY